MTTNPSSNPIISGAVLYMAIELSSSEWKLGFADSPARNPRIRTIKICGIFDVTQKELLKEIAAAKKALGLPDERIQGERLKQASQKEGEPKDSKEKRAEIAYRLCQLKGIALARKLLIALGKYVKDGEIPAGCEMCSGAKRHYTTSLKPRSVKPKENEAQAA